jgi:hypothetical protein
VNVFEPVIANIAEAVLFKVTAFVAVPDRLPVIPASTIAEPDTFKDPVTCALALAWNGVKILTVPSAQLSWFWNPITGIASD